MNKAQFKHNMEWKAKRYALEHMFLFEHPREALMNLVVSAYEKGDSLVGCSPHPNILEAIKEINDSFPWLKLYRDHNCNIYIGGAND